MVGRTEKSVGLRERVWIGLVVVLLAPPARADWTVGGYLGAAHTMASALSLIQPAVGTDLTLDPVAYRGRSFETPLYYGLRVGHTVPIPEGLSIEAEFIHAKVYADTERRVTVRGRRNQLPVDGVEPVSRSVQAFAISHGLNLVLVNLVARVPLGSRRTPLMFVARAGAGPTLPHVESTIAGATREQYEFGSIALAAAAGIEIRLGHDVSALAEYKFTRTRQTVTVPDGEAGALLRMHHGVFGVAYRF